MAKITIYTDGSALGNPGRGGYGAVLISGVYRKELSKGFRLTTNNRMELWAVIAALENLKHEGNEVTVYSDSKYVVDSVEKGWIWTWQKNGYKGKKNEDLWRQFIPLYQKQKLRFVWVKGHADIPENERCDHLATTAAASDKLSVDKAYEAINQ